MGGLSNIFTLIKKEFLLEFRLKSALFSLILYIGGTVFICYMSFALKTQQIQSITWNALFWVVMLFVSFNAIAKSFIGEHRDRNFYYYYVVPPGAIILSKIFYNIIVMIIYGGITLAFFELFLTKDSPVGDPLVFALNLASGGIGFACTLTLIAGIASKTNNGMLMAVLSIPVILPMLILLIKVSNHAMDGLDRSLIWGELGAVLAINMIVITASYILFPYLWRS